MNDNNSDFFCFILPNGGRFAYSEKDGKIDFPWGEALKFIEVARGVFSSHQINNAYNCCICDELTAEFEKGERGIDLMWEVSCFAEYLRGHWNMDNER